MDHTLAIELFHDESTVVVWVKGEIDVVSTPQLQATLEQLPAEMTVVINMRNVAFMDSTALGTLVAQHSRFAAAGGGLCVRQASVPVRNVLRFTCLDHILLEPEPDAIP